MEITPELRENIARVIDPDGFATFDRQTEELRRLGKTSDGPAMYITRALARADEVLAILDALAVPKGGDATSPAAETQSTTSQRYSDALESVTPGRTALAVPPDAEVEGLGGKIGEWIGLSASMIRCGEDFTPRAEQCLNNAKEALAALLRTRSPAAQPDMAHVANEWADAATSGLQWLKNIRDGISTVEDAITNMEECINHCREVRNQHSRTRSPAPAKYIHMDDYNDYVLKQLALEAVDVPDTTAPAGKPVAWRVKFADGWILVQDEHAANGYVANGDLVQPLFPAPAGDGEDKLKARIAELEGELDDTRAPAGGPDRCVRAPVRR